MPPANTSTQGSPHAAIPIAIYTRVSTDGQLGFRYDSCEHQANVCREFIGKNAAAGWFEAGYFKDEAYSGATLDRPGIKQLLGEIAGGRIKVVLVYKFERILRSTYEWARLQRFLSDHGCQLLSPNEDLSDASASGRLKSNMLVSFAEYERMNVAEKTRSKMLAQAKRGMWGGGFIPFGYAYDCERQQLRSAPAEAPVVARIFERAAALQSLGQIAVELNADGLRTGQRWVRDANRVRRPIGEKPFRTDILRKLIQNPIYRGAIRYGDEEFRGQHEPLVTVVIWEQANAAVAEAKRKPKVVLRLRDKHSNLLKGLVYCACCGVPLFSRASGKESGGGKLYRYYTCTGGTRHTEEREPCTLGHIAAEPLESAVIGFIGHAGAAIVATDAFPTAGAGFAALRNKLTTDVAALDVRMSEIDTQIQNCVDVLAAEGIRGVTMEITNRIESLREKKQPLLVQREQCRQELASIDQHQFDRERIRHAFERLGRMLPSKERTQQRELLFGVLDQIRVAVVTRSGAHKFASASGRVLKLVFRVRLTDFVNAMENDVVIDDRTTRTSPYGQRTLEVETEIVFPRKGSVKIVSPIQAELGAPKATEAIATPVQHPIHRAMQWRAELACGDSMRTLAAREKVSAALICAHLKLLRLPPSIQEIIRGLTTPAAVGLFSLRKLAAISELKAEDQFMEFEKLRRQFESTAG
jgi:DNA invertase Pin-like site-specific DNA recombinase